MEGPFARGGPLRRLSSCAPPPRASAPKAGARGRSWRGLVPAGGVEMGDEPAAGPQMEAEPGRVGDDHRAAVGPLGIDPLEVERHLRRGRGADGERRPGPLGDHRAVEMAGDHRRRHCSASATRPQPQHPFGVRILGHPAEAGGDRRMVEGDERRPLRLPRRAAREARPRGLRRSRRRGGPPRACRGRGCAPDDPRSHIGRSRPASRPPGNQARKSARLS